MMKARKVVLVILAAFCLCACEKVEKLIGEKSVAGVYKDLEEAYRTGNGKMWLNLQSKQVLEDLDEPFKAHIEKEGIPPRPNISMSLLSSIEREDKAALFVKYVDAQGEVQYEALMLVLEDGEWKISETEAGNTPIYAHTFFPPEDGSFIKSGATWERIPYALPSDATTLETPKWTVKGVLDESFLYIRMEGQEVLPEPGLELSDPAQTVVPSLSFSIDIIASSTKEATPPEKRFGVTISEGVTTWTTFDETGRADHTEYLLNYSFSYYDQDGNMLFTNSTRSSNPLITMEDRHIDIMIPVPSLGFGNAEDLTVALANDLYFQTYTVNPFDG